MSYYIYNPETSRIQQGKGGRLYMDHEYPTAGAAKAALTRMLKKAENHPWFTSKYDFKVERAEKDLAFVKTLKIAESRLYHDCIEQFEEVVPMFSKTGKTIRQSVNTPAHMDPSRESYWTM